MCPAHPFPPRVLGIDTQWNSSFGLFVDYAAQAGQDDFFGQSVEGGVKVSF
jgi:outer membrane autotransporter protein